MEDKLKQTENENIKMREQLQQAEQERTRAQDELTEHKAKLAEELRQAEQANATLKSELSYQAACSQAEQHSLQENLQAQGWKFMSCSHCQELCQ